MRVEPIGRYERAVRVNVVRGGRLRAGYIHAIC
jgi:hypothetical protein